VNSLEEIVEGKLVPDQDDDFAIQDKPVGFHAAESVCEFRKVARERLPGFGLQFYRVSGAEGDATESIPLGFVLPSRPCRDVRDALGFHGRKRRADGKLHRESL
jgi:hypothetical protein